MSKLEYRIKWYGETPVQAEEALAQIKKELQEAQEIMFNTAQNQQNAQYTSQDRLEKANSSGEKTNLE